MANKVTLTDLEYALEPSQERNRFTVIEQYCRRKPTLDAVPVLIRALSDDCHAVVKCAAISLKKLGPDAREAFDPLLDAARHIDSATQMPQAYCECLDALVAIDKENEEIIELIRHFVGLDNWHPIKHSLQALSTINSEESIDLLRRMYRFWEREFNKQQKKNALKIVEPYLDAEEPSD
ncbi:MAG: hypothetical protein AAGI37_16770 [Planctomycetota bacterium]